MRDIIDGVDPAKAALAFEEMLPLLRAQMELRRATTDINKAVVMAAAVGRMVKQPEILVEFAALPATRFDIQHVLRLESVSLATWHAFMTLQNATAVTTGAKIPDEVVAEATTLKQTMLKVLDYYLGQTTEVNNILSSIREGGGYVDLASDLARLAALYQIHAPVLAVDTVRYRAEDLAAAGRLAQAIHQVLGDGRSSDARTWTDLLARAWSLLAFTYDEVSATGRWLFRHEDGETRFPSLYASGRRRRRSGQSDDAPEGGPDEGDVIVDPAIPQG